MRLLLFVPDDPAQREAVEEILRARPDVRRIEIAALSDKAAGLEAEIAGADRKHGFAIVDPPRGVEDLERIDGICRRRLGKGRLPRAVFFAPPKKKQDPAWREAVKEPYHYFHKARRSVAYAKPSPAALRKAVRTASKTDSLLRWGLLGPMAAAALVLGLGLFLFRDALLKRAAVYGLQSAFGAKAEIDLLSTTLAPALDLGGVAVANARKPMANLFEFDRMRADVNAGPLLSGRLHAEELALEGLRFGGARAESGALPGAEPPPPEPPPDPSVPTFEQALEDFLKRLEPPALDDLETVRRAREIEKQARERMARYEGMAAANPFQARIDRAKKAAEELQTLKPPASVDEATKALSALRPDAAMLEKARADLAAAQAMDLSAEGKSIEAARKEVEGVKKGLEDARATVEKAKEIKKISLLDAPKIAGLLRDLAAAQKTLEGAAGKLDAARTTLETAKKDAARKQEEAAAKLKSADESIAAARKAADAGGEAGGNLAAIAPQLAQAKADLEKHRAEVEAKVKASKGELDAARSDVEAFRKGVADDLEFMRKAPAHLQEGVEIDRKELLARYDLKQFSAEELVRSLLGEEAARYVRWTLAAHGALKPWLSRPKQPKPRKAPLDRGAVYEFPLPEGPSEPRVWIKKATFTGAVSLQGEKGTLEGTATHLSTDPAFVGQEARLEVRASAGARKLSLVLTVSPAGDVTGDLAVEGFDLKGGTLKNKYLAADFGSGGAALKLRLALGEAGLRADGTVAFTGLKIEPAPGGDAKLAFVGDLVKGIDRLNAGFHAEASERGLTSFRVTSDQAAGLTDKLKGAVAGRVEEAKQKALSGLDAQVAGPRRQAEQAAAQFLGQAPGKADGVTGGLSFEGAEGAGALARLDSLEKLLSGGPAGGDQAAALRKELDALSARSAARKDQNAKDGAAQAASADAALSTLSGQKDALGGIQAAIAAELDRLKKLR